MRAVKVSRAIVEQHAADLLKSDAQILLLRAVPDWPFGDIHVEADTVRVVTAISQLAVLDILDSLPDTQKAVVLTDRPEDDLGDTILTRAFRQGIEFPDEWQAVPRLFPGAIQVDRGLRSLSWAATALLDHQPAGGWPKSLEPAVTARHAIGALLLSRLGLNPDTTLDEVTIMTTLSSAEGRRRWAETELPLMDDLISWTETEIGRGTRLALQIAQNNELVTPLAMGFALDVLWGDGHARDDAQIAARVRVERYVAGKPLDGRAAKELARIANAAYLRLESDHRSTLNVALRQAEQLLVDLDWASGAGLSTLLPLGYAARVRELSSNLEDGEGLEESLRAVLEHRDSSASETPTMAVRLRRWLDTPENETSSLGDDLQRQMSDGAWVDAAIGAVWNGSTDPTTSQNYLALLERVAARRTLRDQVAAAKLSEIGANDLVLGVEEVLKRVVAPWRQKTGALLVVLDGMSSAIATNLGAEVTQLGFVEWVPNQSMARLPVAAALPTLTNVSRASLFAGEITSGTAIQEKRSLSDAFPGAQLFHKDDLRAAGGAALPERARRAIVDTSVPVVGVVINAIDDSAHKTDTSALEWNLRSLEPLRAILELAVAARRSVILTSDHGHVIERDTYALPMQAGSRWREGNVPNDGEVAVSGPRVVAPDNEAVLLWTEKARYGQKNAGYHGGASLAELTIPVLAFRPAGGTNGPDGWVEAPPQAPTWWNSPVIVSAPFMSASAKPKKATRTSQGQGLLNFESLEPPKNLVDLVIESATYREQKRMAGRAFPGDEVIRVVLDTLISRGGRAHQDTVASIAGIATANKAQVFTAVRRIVNVDAYDVIETDTDGVTLKLDEKLLREQFEVD